MKIDTSNYEIWIIDLLDGNLTDIEVEQVLLFLEHNPELKEEFNELTSFILSPSNESFPLKGKLKKTTSDLSGFQFEYLCAAYLENDLPVAWQSGLKEIIENNPEKRRTFSLIQRTRLYPFDTGYKNKDHLLKARPLIRAIRFFVIGITAAAAIGLLIILKYSLPGTLNSKKDISAQNILTDSNLQKPYLEIKRGRLIKAEKPVELKKETPSSVVRNYISGSLTADTSEIKAEDTSIPRNVNPPVLQAYVNIIEGTDLIKVIPKNRLVASTITFSPPPDADGRSKIGRFIAKTFREKIMRAKVINDTPLKGYEIAEAGVTGLNKLLGWKMALNEKNDENGELKSVSFNSKILNFNAPVKKSVPQP
jgi:hypothetical protein